MSDLERVLPNFPIGGYTTLLPTLERQGVTTSDLLALDVAALSKRTQLPLLELKRLSDAVLDALHRDLGVADAQPETEREPSRLRSSTADLAGRWSTISTLDPVLDAALNGGVPTGHITEITGESGAGKTQFLLSLLLAAQLPPPHGVGRPALYISTEAPLSTKRLSQILASHPLFTRGSGTPRPSLDNIMSTVTPDLESQDHILNFQVPVEVARRNVGLIVLDSVAANYRAEFERGAKSLGSNMGARSNELVKLGALLRDLARKHNLAVVVANQVADRFASAAPPRVPSRSGNISLGVSQDSPLASRSKGPADLPAVPSSSMSDVVRSAAPEPAGLGDDGLPAHPALLLDHQQRWFTGWGDDPVAHYSLKTPSLGLVWSTQIACRIALFKEPMYGTGRRPPGKDERGMPTLRSWRRWMKVVFAPHAPASGLGLRGAVEFEVTMAGLRACGKRRTEDHDNTEEDNRANSLKRA